MTYLDKIHIGDCLDYLKNLPSEIVDCCVTSPPYYGLRDYGVDGQIGLEETPAAFIARLVEVFHEIRRVLKPCGTLWVNIGDSYAGSGKGGATHPENAAHYKQGTSRGMIGKKSTTKVGFGECKPKDLIGIPWMLAFALRADGWYLRQDIIWHKPNPMPESVGDRCTKAHEYIFLLSKSPRYYFNADAIKEAAKGWNGSRFDDGRNLVNHPNTGRNRQRKPAGWDTGSGSHGAFHRTGRAEEIEYTNGVPEHKNKRSVWTVAPEPFKEAHFATYPKALVVPCILAGCPEDGIVLDPFMGSGTTAVVARKLDRHFIGCDLNPQYIHIAEERLKREIGLFL